MARQVPGDPLTGSLPRTKVYVPQAVLGPTRVRRARPVVPQWPLIPDAAAVTGEQMKSGRVAYVRTRFGVRTWQIRVVARSHEPGKNRGRHYFVGMTQRGWCRSAWVDQVIRVDTVQRALAAGKALKAIGPGHADS